MNIAVTLLLSISLFPGKENVYVCKGTSVTTYHAKKECRKIKSCSQEVLEVSLQEATDQHKKKACKNCYKEADIFLFPSPVIVPLDGLED